MRPRIILSTEQLVRDELALQRRLGDHRRAASALMPPLRRTGMHKKHPAPAVPSVRKGVDELDMPPSPAQPLPAHK